MEFKTCKNCLKEKTLSDFYSRKTNGKRGSGVYYHPECKECTRLKSVKWQQDNREYYLKRKRKYNKNQRKTNESFREFERNHSKIQREKGYYRTWQQHNPNKMKGYNNSWSIKRHSITPKEWDDCRIYFNFRCAYCGKTWEQNKKETNKDLHKDHLVNDGRNDLKNCVPACMSCNSSKGEQSLNNWYNCSNEAYSYERYHQIYLWIRYDCHRYLKKKKVKLKN